MKKKKLEKFYSTLKRKIIIPAVTLTMVVSMLTACNSTSKKNETTTTEITTSSESVSDENTSDNTANASEEIENTNDGEHAIEVDGEEKSYTNVKVTKSGDSEKNDEADFYGDNSAIFATNKANLTLSNLDVSTNGAHANAVFSYGEGTTVNISDSTIETSGNCSGGLMTTGGGTMNANNVTIKTSGNSSAAIRSDRGGGTVTVNGGLYETSGTGSPSIYSTADITVSDATLSSTTSEGIVIEGKNSVTLNNCDLTANNTEHNSDKSDVYKGIMIYQSMSGDAASGKATFAATNGSITNQKGDVFFVNNTSTDISLENVTIANEDSTGVFLRAEAAGWGNEGSNGGKVNLNAKNQTIDGNIIVDDISVLNLYLKEGSAYAGAINAENSSGEIYVELDANSTWTLTGDSYITSLTCSEGSINLNGHKLYINGKEYKEGSASTGEAIEIKEESGGNTQDGNKPDSENAQGNAPSGEKPDGEPPEKPDGDSNHTPPSDGGTPPEKPDGTTGATPKGDSDENTNNSASNSTSSDNNSSV